MAVVRDCASLLIGLLVFFHTWGAWAAVDIEMEDKVSVVKGGTAQITGVLTTDEGVGSMIIQWFYMKKSGEKQKIYYQDSTIKLIEPGTPFTDRISVNGTGAPGDLVLTITDVQLSDETQFICIVRTIDMTTEGRTSLKVYDTPAYPTIDVVQTGISVTEDELSKIATCEVKNGYPKPTITWYRNDTPLRINNEVKIEASSTIESSGLVSVKSELSMKVMKEDKDAKFYCESSYQVPEGIKFSETKRFNITVFYPSTAVSVWVESPKGKIKEGDLVELHCQGDGNMASIITINHKDKSWETAVLTLDNVKRLDSGDYQCSYVETETFSEISGETNLFVHYLDEAVVSPSDLELDKGAKLEATCNALSSLQTHVVWFKNGEEVSKGNTLMLKDTMFESSGTYVCVVTVPEIEGMKTNGTLLVKINGQPEISNPKHTEMEESSGNVVELTCSIKGFPTPTVDWSTSEGKVLMGAHEEESEQGMVSRLSVQVDSDTFIFCNASNTYGTDGVAFNIKTIMHTTSPATTTTITTSSTATPTIISSSTVKANTETPQKKIKKEGSGVIIAVIIICILLLAILGSVLYFLYKKGKICGRSGKQDLTKEKSNKDSIVVEMKSDNTEEAVLLGVNGEKQPPSDQGGEYLDVQK